MHDELSLRFILLSTAKKTQPIVKSSKRKTQNVDFSSNCSSCQVVSRGEKHYLRCINNYCHRWEALKLQLKGYYSYWGVQKLLGQKAKELILQIINKYISIRLTLQNVILNWI